MDRKLQVKVVEQENVIACLREEIAGKASIEAKHLRAADELQIQTTRCEELEKEVVRLKGFKEKLEQAGEMRKRLNEKEQELDKMLEQVFLFIHLRNKSWIRCSSRHSLPSILEGKCTN